MKIRALIPVSALALLAFLSATPLTATRQAPATASTGGQELEGLDPGSFVTLRQTVPVDIVLIGFGQGHVNESDLGVWLPPTYEPVVRYPRFYGLNGRNTGLEYSFQYDISHADAGLTDQFFKYLRSIGTEIPLTHYQTRYNAQLNNVVEIQGPVLDIEAAAVERWLAAKAKPRATGYTVYFINWYGRPDFRFHVYTKKDDPDPDTGGNFGASRFGPVNAWGGSTSRSWFYDFSAGPEYNTANWVVDVADITGDGVEDYRMPPIWEYSNAGYRSPDALGTDMGLLTRFVAINLLFTTSPLYDPMVASPSPLGRRVVDMTMLEDDPLSNGIDYIDADFARARWRSFQPYYQWATGLRAVDPIDAGAKQALDIFTENSAAPDCWNAYGTPFAQLFCYFSDNLGAYLPAYPARDYVVPVFGFNTTEAGLGSQFGLLGFADDNWVDGTQSLVFAFNADIYRSAGYGFTGTTIHEVGHHIGMSHPHDGFDPVFDDYGPSGPLWFAWEGDESDTVMHYLTLTNSFGEHNRDNMYRWETAGYLNWSNALAGDILAHPDADRVRSLIQAADARAARAQANFTAWRYLNAVAEARQAYTLLSAAAEIIGASADSLSSARRLLPPSAIEKYVCRPRHLNEVLAPAFR